jgi:hypothetical protein
MISGEADNLASVNLRPSGAKRCVFPSLMAFLSIRNFPQRTRSEDLFSLLPADQELN